LLYYDIEFEPKLGKK